MARPADFYLSDPHAASHFLNSHDIATLIYHEGYRL